MTAPTVRECSLCDPIHVNRCAHYGELCVRDTGAGLDRTIHGPGVVEDGRWLDICAPLGPGCPEYSPAEFDRRVALMLGREVTA
jgi:hypothetical protein